MGTAERRNEILRILCRRRHETIENLASELAVSKRTIRRDIDVLSMTYPIYTQTGKYNGGVYVMDGFFLERMYMNDTELNVLKKIYIISQNDNSLLTKQELLILNSIISTYSKPAKWERKIHETKRKKFI